MPTVVIPTPGRDVLYRSKTGNYALPAKVSVTIDNLHIPSVEQGLIESLSSPIHAHLKVLNPGPEYVELNVPHATLHPEFDARSNPFPPGSWRWPDLVPDRTYDTEASGLEYDRVPLTWN